MFQELAADYGLTIAVLIVGFLGFFAAILRGDLVPGKAHQERVAREEEITDKAIDNAERSNAAIEKLTDSFERFATEVQAWRSIERRTGPR